MPPEITITLDVQEVALAVWGLASLGFYTACVRILVRARRWESAARRAGVLLQDEAKTRVFKPRGRGWRRT